MTGSPPHSCCPRILLIESSNHWRSQAALWLRARNHAIECAPSFQAAYLLLKLLPPDIVVLDLDDIDIDSLVTISQLMKQQQRCAPILIADPDQIPDLAAALGTDLAYAVIAKPIDDIQALLATIDQAWHQSERHAHWSMGSKCRP